MSDSWLSVLYYIYLNKLYIDYARSCHELPANLLTATAEPRGYIFKCDLNSAMFSPQSVTSWGVHLIFAESWVNLGRAEFTLALTLKTLEKLICVSLVAGGIFSTLFKMTGEDWIQEFTIFSPLVLSGDKHSGWFDVDSDNTDAFSSCKETWLVTCKEHRTLLFFALPKLPYFYTKLPVVFSWLGITYKPATGFCLADFLKCKNLFF